ncbi:unnamed protein product [Cyclocybe aegerita]|uniref:Uncharacterized protein n=1 Tax=Cyclocybe aegerita TaxID=1973307 RepID=A0A8S0W3Q1_CYCAE|nr:unnamed protein product [Cyclocybe aegerita]
MARKPTVHDADGAGNYTAYQLLLHRIVGSTIKQPRLKTPSNIWRKSRQSEIEEATRRHALENGLKPKQVPAAREREKEEWERQAKEEHEQDLVRWKADTEGPLPNDPDFQQQCIEALPLLMQPLLDGIRACTGLNTTLLFGGPEPADGGRMKVFGMHSGHIPDDPTMNFGRAERKRYDEHLVPIFGDFLRSAYTPEECKARALPNEHRFSLADQLSDEDGVNVNTIDFVGHQSNNEVSDSSTSTHLVPLPPAPVPSASAPPIPAPPSAARAVPTLPTTKARPRMRAAPTPAPLASTSSTATLLMPIPSLPWARTSIPSTSTRAHFFLPPLPAFRAAAPADFPVIVGPIDPPATSRRLRLLENPAGIPPPTAPDHARVEHAILPPPRAPAPIPSTTSMQNPFMSFIPTSTQVCPPPAPADTWMEYMPPSPWTWTPSTTSIQGRYRPPVPNFHPAAPVHVRLEPVVPRVPEIPTSSPTLTPRKTHFQPSPMPISHPATAEFTTAPAYAVVHSPPQSHTLLMTPTPTQPQSPTPIPAPISPPAPASAQVGPAWSSIPVGIQMLYELPFANEDAGVDPDPVSSDNLPASESPFSSAPANVVPISPIPVAIPSQPVAAPLITSPPVIVDPEPNAIEVHPPSTSGLNVDDDGPEQRYPKHRPNFREASAPSSKRVHLTTSAASSSSTPIAPPSDAPDWLPPALSMLQQGSLGEPWIALVRTWLSFEVQSHYEPVANLSATHRPPAVRDWIQRARAPAWRPQIPNVGKYGAQFWRWWAGLQPSWRRDEDGDVVMGAVEGDWEPLRRPGVNGLLSVLVALFFWGGKVQKTRVAKEKWLLAVKDVHLAMSKVSELLSPE